MIFIKTTTAVATAALMLVSASVAFAAEGTTLAGPAQGSKSDGFSAAQPSGEGTTGAATAGSAGGTVGTATGEMTGNSTATGGNVRGAAGRN